MMRQSVLKASSAWRCSMQQRWASTASADYGKQRKEYQQELTKLRKQWQSEFQEKQEDLQEMKRLQQKKIVLEKAIRLREKRQKSLLRQAEDRKIRERSQRLHMEKLARTHLIWDDKYKLQQKYYELALKDLSDEEHTWITLENLDEKITEDLFQLNASTTGLKNKYSNFWRTHVKSTAYRMEVDFHPEKYPSNDSISALEERLLRSQETKFTKRRIVEEFVDDMISSGEERERFHEYVDNFYNLFEEAGAMSWVDEGHAALLDEESGINTYKNKEDNLEAVIFQNDEDNFIDEEYYDFKAAEMEDSGETSPATTTKNKKQQQVGKKTNTKKGKK